MPDGDRGGKVTPAGPADEESLPTGRQQSVAEALSVRDDLVTIDQLRIEQGRPYIVPDAFHKIGSIFPGTERADPSGSASTMRVWGKARRRYRATPAKVPPVPLRTQRHPGSSQPGGVGVEALGRFPLRGPSRSRRSETGQDTRPRGSGQRASEQPPCSGRGFREGHSV